MTAPLTGSRQRDRFAIPPHVTIDFYRRFGLSLAPLSLAFHAGFMLFFALQGIWVLCFSYLSGFLVHLWIRHTGDRLTDFSRIIILLWVLNLLQTFVAVICLGTASGFHFYILALLPATLVSENSRFSKLLQTIVYTAFFLFCDGWVSQWTPRTALDAELTGTLRLFNIGMSCLMIAGISYASSRISRDARETFHRLASVDPLTGLLNRRYMSEIAGQQSARSKRGNAPLTILMSDIDYFKEVNDCYGHAAGDHVLTIIANVFQATVREYDIVARWGGEEFLVLFPDTDLETATTVAERLQSAIKNTTILFGRHSIKVTLTMGLAQLGAHEHWQSTVTRADQALYSGKQAGRDRIAIATGTTAAELAHPSQD